MQTPTDLGTASNFDQRFGELIRARRESLGWTQMQLAAALQAEGLLIAQSALAKAEAGVRSIKVAEAASLAKVLSMHLDLYELAAGEDLLAGMLARANAEAETAVRLAQDAFQNKERQLSRVQALGALSRARSEPIEWVGDQGDLLEEAFGLDPNTARAGLVALGVPRSAIAELEDQSHSNPLNRANWRELYGAIPLATYLPMLTFVRG